MAKRKGKSKGKSKKSKKKSQAAKRRKRNRYGQFVKSKKRKGKPKGKSKGKGKGKGKSKGKRQKHRAVGFAAMDWAKVGAHMAEQAERRRRAAAGFSGQKTHKAAPKYTAHQSSYLASLRAKKGSGGSALPLPG